MTYTYLIMICWCMSQVLTTPCVVILQYFFYDVDLPNQLKLSLVPVCLGVTLATVSDFSFNMVGFFWATMGLVATAFYQLLVKTRQDKLGADSWQLLDYQAPQSFALVILCTPLFDQVTGPTGFSQVQDIYMTWTWPHGVPTHIHPFPHPSPL